MNSSFDLNVTDLTSNALNSLEHGLEHLINQESHWDLKHSVLLLFNSCELFAKATLIKNDPEIVWIDKARRTTIKWDRSVTHLKKRFPDKFDGLKKLRRLANVRNDLSHLAPTKNITFDQLDSYFMQAFSFIFEACSILEIQLRDELGEEFFDAFLRWNDNEKLKLPLMHTLIEKEVTHVDPKERATSYNLQALCPYCGEASSVTSVSSSTGKCFHPDCGKTFETKTCQGCGKVETSDDFYLNWHQCDDCCEQSLVSWSKD